LSERRRYWLVLGLAALGFAALTRPVVYLSGNDASRFAQIEALVDYGRPTIEGTTFAWTVDRVEVGSRIYSNKPPLLALVGALLYAPLEAATGWRLGDPATMPMAVFLLIWCLVGLPAAWLVAQFDHELRRFETLGGRWRTVLTASLALGTLVTSFAGTLNNHVPAAALLFAAFAAALGGRAGRCGLLAGLAGAVDILPGFGLAPFLGWIALREGGGDGDRRRRIARIGLGFGAALAVTAAANLFVAGSFLFPRWVVGGKDVAASVGPSVGGALFPHTPLYSFEILFGPHGLFLVSPVLLLGAVGHVLAARRPPFGHRASWVALSVGLLAQYAGHAAVAGSYGGWSYGYRFLIPMQPLLLFAAPVALAFPARRRFFAAMLPFSVSFALLGAYHPWPPGFEGRSPDHPVAGRVRNPIGASLAALCRKEVGSRSICGGLARRFVGSEPELVRRYFLLYFATRRDDAMLRELRR